MKEIESMDILTPLDRSLDTLTTITGVNGVKRFMHDRLFILQNAGIYASFVVEEPKKNANSQVKKSNELRIFLGAQFQPITCNDRYSTNANGMSVLRLGCHETFFSEDCYKAHFK